jgi:hypothetical protein
LENMDGHFCGRMFDTSNEDKSELCVGCTKSLTTGAWTSGIQYIQNTKSSPNVGNRCWHNLYKPNTCLFRTQKLVPMMFGLDRFYCISIIHIIFSIIWWNECGGSTINKRTKNHISPQIIEHEKDHDIWHWESRSFQFLGRTKTIVIGIIVHDDKNSI